MAVRRPVVLALLPMTSMLVAKVSGGQAPSTAEIERPAATEAAS
ncbi:hypothetical protein [Streptomyces sp. NPDC046942]